MRAENMVNCPSCGASLVAGLRFCRRCGYRLGEGVEEYVPTQRFDAASMPAAAQTPSPATDPFQARQTWGAPPPVQPIQPFGSVSPMGGQQAPGSTSKLARMCRPVRGVWLWVTIIAVMLIVGGLLPLALLPRRVGDGVGGGDKPVNSLLDEADAYITADGGGAMIAGLAGPGTTLEAAGLIGGDIIVNLGGQSIRDASVLKKLLAAAAPGKPLPVTYIRDGETKQTELIPTGAEGFRGMEPIRQRPGGRGVLNVDFDDGDRVRVPGSNIYGVELDGVERNGPADLAGLKKGDIIVEFDGKLIRTAGDLRYRAGAATPFGIIQVVVFREGQMMTIPVKMGRQR